LDTPTAVVRPSSTASFKLSMSAEFENVGNGKWIYRDGNHGHIFTQLLINTSMKDCASVNSADLRYNKKRAGSHEW
jgi:hypothetical protein